jgi:hypothetical protein
MRKLHSPSLLVPTTNKKVRQHEINHKCTYKKKKKTDLGHLNMFVHHRHQSNNGKIYNVMDSNIQYCRRRHHHQYRSKLTTYSSSLFINNLMNRIMWILYITLIIFCTNDCNGNGRSNFIQPANAIHVKLSLTNVLKLFQHYEKEAAAQLLELKSKSKLRSNSKIPTREGITTDIGHTEMAPIPVPQLPGKPMSCFGLPAVACQNTQDMENAGNAKDECKKMFCNPLCLRDVWKCDIEGGTGAFGVVGSPAVSRALCNEFIAYGCSVIFQCCDYKDPMLHRFIQPSYVGTESAPNSIIKIAPCAHGTFTTYLSDN